MGMGEKEDFSFHDGKMMELHKHGEVISNAGEVRSKYFHFTFLSVH